jgi:hypothetical protein
MAEKVNKQLEITPISALKDYAQGEIVEFPPFSPEQRFVARVKRPSMMVLMKTGKIPNSLMSTATKLFAGNQVEDTGKDDIYSEVLGIIEVLAEASFIEPTWGELKEAGIELTDEQYTFLFNYTQRGVKALEPFCE